LLEFFGEEITEEKLFRFIKRTDKGVLQTKLVESSLEELREATRRTYTEEKKEILAEYALLIHKEKFKKEYLERLEYELKVIHEMGYNTYFLVVRDYISRAKENHIMV
jgi:DNA polymerase-3 subunit alpha